jgi:uncharacterized protein (DUF305 family)
MSQNACCGVDGVGPANVIKSFVGNGLGIVCQPGFLLRWIVLTVACVVLAATSHASDWHVNRACAQFEMRLLKGLIEHHQLASELASLGATRSVHEELRNLCVFNTWALRSKIGQHRRMLADLYEVTYEPIPTRQDERILARLSALSDEEFEQALLKELVKLDSSVLRLGRHCDRRAGHPELASMWSQVGEGLLTESAQLRMWLCEWYSRCNGTAAPEPAAAP